jgi:hypothetical protein
LLQGIKYRTLTPQQIRRAGWLLIVLGLFLTVLNLALLAYVLGFFNLSDIFPGVYRVEDSVEDESAAGAFLFIGIFLSFGLLTLTAGIWQVWHGRALRNLWIVMLAMFAVMELAALIAEAFL